MPLFYRKKKHKEVVGMNMKKIAVIHTGFLEKFGIPRQSGLVEGAQGYIEFFPEYRRCEAFRGLEGYSHIWLLWEFSKAKKEHWAATVTPPRLGGKKRVGVFATRSPFRPNPIGMSVVKLEEIIPDENKGIILRVSGVDMLDETPIYDIKPYLPYADSYPQATDGFAGEVLDHQLKVVWKKELEPTIPDSLKKTMIDILQQDPRTAFIEDESRVWGVTYDGYNVRFTVQGDILEVCEVKKVRRER